MSKSAPSSNSYIALLDSPEEIRRKIKIAVTDSGKEVKYDPKSKPAISNLMAIYSAFAGLSYDTIEKRYHAKDYAEFKKELAELLVQKLSPIQKKYQELTRDEKKIKKILLEGSEEARQVARKTINMVKERIGLVL